MEKKKAQLLLHVGRRYFCALLYELIGLSACRVASNRDVCVVSCPPGIERLWAKANKWKGSGRKLLAPRSTTLHCQQPYRFSRQVRRAHTQTVAVETGSNPNFFPLFFSLSVASFPSWFRRSPLDATREPNFVLFSRRPGGTVGDHCALLSLLLADFVVRVTGI